MARTTNSSDGRIHNPIIIHCPTTSSPPINDMTDGDSLLQSIRGRSLASLNADEVVGTFNPSLFDDTPIPFNLAEHQPADINTVQLVRLINMSEELTKSSLTTNDPINNTIPQLGYSKRFAANGSGASYNHAPNNGTSSQMLDLNLIFLDPDTVVPRNDSMASLNTNKEKKKKKKQKRVIDLSTAIEPTENDILFGRGSKSNKHPGNILFREKARELGSWFISCSSKEEKYKISEVLVEFIKADNRRFLEMGPDGLWYKVVGNGTRKKASQALRDESSAASSLLTTNVPSNNIIPQQCGKREWFAASGRDASCNPAPKKRECFGKSGLSLMNAGMFSSEKSQLNQDSLFRSEEFVRVVDAVRDDKAANDEVSISDFIISNFIEDLNCEENQVKKKKKKKQKRVIDLSTAIEPTENDILFGRGSKSNKNPGNILFREKARDLGSWFISCSSKEEKYKVSEALVECIKGENRRFLEKGPDGLWYEVIGNGTRKKASQALRESQGASRSVSALEKRGSKD
jgi:hypothetical protein